MILTFLYAFATVVQSRRISLLRGHLRALFQGTSGPPSVILYNKNPLDSHRDSDSAMTSGRCANKNDAKLGELLWFRDEMTLCTIYPQQEVIVSNWLAEEAGKTSFPLFANHCPEQALEPEHEVFLLVEADPDSCDPEAAASATKIEDYGLLVCWTANSSIGLVLQSDLDSLTKFLIAAMEGARFDNGIVLKRIETVRVSGSPCSYTENSPSPPSDIKLLGQIDWRSYMEKLQAISETAKLAREQGKFLEVAEYPGLTVYPEPGDATALMDRLEAQTPVGNIGICRASTPTPLNIQPQADFILDGEVTIAVEKVDISQMKAVETFEKPAAPEKLENLESAKKVDAEPTDKAQTESPKKGTPEAQLRTSPEKSAAAISTELNGRSCKPPNVLIYADSEVERTNVKRVLEESLGSEKYAIYSLTLDEVKQDVWMENAALVVVCGNVGGEIGSQLVEYILHGGKLLALCSDVLHVLLPTFKTAEVRENELVHFSYGKWRHVCMMHHIFCYQPSPIRTRFSQEQEDGKEEDDISQKKTEHTKAWSPRPPTSARIKDKRGRLHTFDVRVLGTEETWQSPSILLATLPDTGGRVVFSQVHLEIDPMQYQFEETKFVALKESNSVRSDIFNDLLETYLNIEINDAPLVAAAYTPAFFLGRHELKLEMLEPLKSAMQANDTLKMRKLEVQFCRGNTTPRHASSSYLPIMLHQCPEHFSTIEYFENLKTNDLGRLVIYADIMTSTMDALAGSKLHHGLTVITRQQTRGQGRGRNVWLSPKGCAMFSMQVHIANGSILGSRISILQHLVAVAIVRAVRSLPGYQDIDLRVKWPNDIYVSEKVKIGGICLSSQIDSTANICNIGAGVNLFNSKPTCCINDIIQMYNEKQRTNLKLISFEQYFALVFNEIENLLSSFQNGDTQGFLDLYYKYWMHSGAQVTVVSATGRSQSVKIIGIDTYGFLLVQGVDGKTFSLHPNGNSFDPLKGLIIPK